MLVMRHRTGPSHGFTGNLGLRSLEVTHPRSKISMLGGIDWGCIKKAEVTVMGKLQVADESSGGDPSRAGSLPMGYSLLSILTVTFGLLRVPASLSCWAVSRHPLPAPRGSVSRRSSCSPFQWLWLGLEAYSYVPLSLRSLILVLD